MSKTQLKRIALPRTWDVPRKKSLDKQKMKFVSRPNPGKSFNLCVSLNTFLKEVLNIARTKKEVKALLQFKHVFVNGTRVRDEKFPVGLFDVVYLEEMDKSYRLILSNFGKISSVEIDNKEKDIMLRQIEGKTSLKKGKIQINTFGGFNILADKIDGNVGDVLLIEKDKIKKTFKFKKGNSVLLIAGKYIGSVAKIIDIQDRKLFIDIDGNKVETLKNYAYVVGEKNPEIKLKP